MTISTNLHKGKNEEQHVLLREKTSRNQMDKIQNLDKCSSSIMNIFRTSINNFINTSNDLLTSIVETTVMIINIKIPSEK